MRAKNQRVIPKVTQKEFHVIYLQIYTVCYKHRSCNCLGVRCMYILNYTRSLEPDWPLVETNSFSSPRVGHLLQTKAPKGKTLWKSSRFPPVMAYGLWWWTNYLVNGSETGEKKHLLSESLIKIGIFWYSSYQLVTLVGILPINSINTSMND